MSASAIIRRDGSPQTERRIAVLDAITAGLRPGPPVLHLRRIRAARAVLAALADGGWLAPLPGEQDKRLTDLLGEVEHRLDTKGVTRR